MARKSASDAIRVGVDNPINRLDGRDGACFARRQFRQLELEGFPGVVGRIARGGGPLLRFQTFEPGIETDHGHVPEAIQEGVHAANAKGAILRSNMSGKPRVLITKSGHHMLFSKMNSPQ